MSSLVPRVAFQGEIGAFSEEALQSYFGARGAVAIACREFADVRTALLNGYADFGILPLENSIAGRVAEAHEVLQAGALSVIDHIERPIVHCLLGVQGGDIRSIRRVLSHPVALAQCGRYLASLTGAELVATYDTAGAAMQIARDGDAGSAAVASVRAAQHYGLVVLTAGIQDSSDNRTRFAVIAPSSRAK